MSENRTNEVRIHTREHESQAGRPENWTPYDGTAIEENLRDLGRILADEDEAEERASIPFEPWFRIDESHAGASAWGTNSESDRDDYGDSADGQGESVIAKVPWAVLLFGVSAFAFGGVLLSWSVVAGRPELWNTGIPVLLVGQIGLLVGLMLQLDRLWHENRRTAEKVELLELQLNKPHTCGCKRSDPGQEEAGVADLEGDLDRLSREDDR